MVCTAMILKQVDVKVAGSMAAQVASWIADHPAVHWYVLDASERR